MIVLSIVEKQVFCFNAWNPKVIGKVIYDTAALPFIADLNGYAVTHRFCHYCGVGPYEEHSCGT